MKKRLSLLLFLVFATSLICVVPASAAKAPKAAKAKKGKGAATTAAGYKIDGNKVIFTFNPADYPAGFDETEEVTVAGDFNSWDAGAADWQAKKGKDGIWTFETTKDKVPSGQKFKFVVNTVDWQQPDPAKVPKESLADDGYGGLNLIVNY